MENETTSGIYGFPKVNIIDGVDENGKTSNRATAQKEILLQLHQQFAENSNASLNTIISMIASLIAVLGAYGYVYIRTGHKFVDCFYFSLVDETGTFYIDALFLTTICAAFVLSILAYICINVGMSHRNEQFIINAIREHYFIKDKEKGTQRIFPRGYHPFYIDEDNVVLGVFGKLVYIFKITGGFLILSFILKIPWCLYPDKSILAEGIIAAIAFYFAYRFPKNEFDSSFRQYKKNHEDYFGKLEPISGSVKGNTITFKPDSFVSYYVLKLTPLGRIDDKYIITSTSIDGVGKNFSGIEFNEVQYIKIDDNDAICAICQNGFTITMVNAHKVKAELYAINH